MAASTLVQTLLLGVETGGNFIRSSRDCLSLLLVYFKVPSENSERADRHHRSPERDDHHRGGRSPVKRLRFSSGATSSLER